MSAFGGEADEDQRPPELPLIAISGHWRRVISNRNMAHCDTSGESRPPHQEWKTVSNVRNGSGAAANVDPIIPLLYGAERTLGLGMSAFRGEADEDQRPPERPLIAISGHSGDALMTFVAIEFSPHCPDDLVN